MPLDKDAPNSRRTLFVFLALAAGVGLLLIAGVRVFKPGTPAVEFREVLHTSAETRTPAVESGLSRDLKKPRQVDFPVLLLTTADTTGHKLQVGLRFTVDGDSAAALLRSRTEGVERIVRFVFAGLSQGQVQAGPVRRELLERVNAFLSGAPVADITFTVFDIVP